MPPGERRGKGGRSGAGRALSPTGGTRGGWAPPAPRPGRAGGKGVPSPGCRPARVLGCSMMRQHRSEDCYVLRTKPAPSRGGRTDGMDRLQNEVGATSAQARRPAVGRVSQTPSLTHASAKSSRTLDAGRTQQRRRRATPRCVDRASVSRVCDRRGCGGSDGLRGLFLCHVGFPRKE